MLPEGHGPDAMTSRLHAGACPMSPHGAAGRLGLADAAHGPLDAWGAWTEGHGGTKGTNQALGSTQRGQPSTQPWAAGQLGSWAAGQPSTQSWAEGSPAPRAGQLGSWAAQHPALVAWAGLLHALSGDTGPRLVRLVRQCFGAVAAC